MIYWLSWRNEVVVLCILSPNLFSYSSLTWSSPKSMKTLVDSHQLVGVSQWSTGAAFVLSVKGQLYVFCVIHLGFFVCLVCFCATGDDLSVDPSSSLLQELRFMKVLQVFQVILKVLCITHRPTSFGGTGWVSSVLHQQNKAQRKWKPMCMWHWTSWRRRLWQKTRWGWPGPTGLDNRKLGENLDKSNSVGSVSNKGVSCCLETAGSGAML